MTAAKGRQRRGRADHGTGGHENEVCVEETTLRATIIVHSLQVGHSNFCSVHALPPHKDMYLSPTYHGGKKKQSRPSSLRPIDE
jgi:hypothetical protein